MMRDSLIKLLDVCWREPKLKFRSRSGLWGRMGKSGNYIFMVDGRIHHGGMFDRLKGAVTVYAVAKAQQKDFKINWTYPFDLRKYLEPVDVDWTIDEKSMNFNLFTHHTVIAYGEYKSPVRLFKKRRRETHFYYGYDSLKEVNENYHCNFEWGKLYRELFKPTSYLQQHLDLYQSEIGNDYIAIHTRFMNLLGDKTETDINPELPLKGRERLKQDAVRAVRKIIMREETAYGRHVRVMIASDSMNFIRYVQKEIADVYIVPGTAKHIDTAGQTSDGENIKMFTDYYLMAQARKVYSLWHEGMWKSAFPEYAARIGGVHLERVDF